MKGLKPQSNKKLLFYVGLLLLALWLMVGLKICSRPVSDSKQVDRKSGGDTIDVAIEYSPMSFYGYADTIGGFNYDLLRKIADQEGLLLKFHPVADVGSAMELLGREIVDIVVSSIPPNDSLRTNYLISEPTFVSHQVLIRHKPHDSQSSAHFSTLDLSNCSIHVSSNSPAILRLANLSAEIGDTIVVVEEKELGNEQLFLKVSAGDIDMAVVNESLVQGLISRHPEVEKISDISLSQFQSWLISKSRPDLKTKLDSAIVREKQTPYYESLLGRYGIK